VQTDSTVPNNKPDSIMSDNEKEACMLTDAAITGDRYVINKGAERTLKYKDLKTETQHVSNNGIGFKPFC
jgi:hypothetical protein